MKLPPGRRCSVLSVNPNLIVAGRIAGVLGIDLVGVVSSYNNNRAICFCLWPACPRFHLHVSLASFR